MDVTGKIVKRKLSDEVFDRLYALIRSGSTHRVSRCRPSAS